MTDPTVPPTPALPDETAAPTPAAPDETDATDADATAADSTLGALAPVRAIPGDGAAPEEGMALCLSGGGARAMLFHAGSLLRLNELGLLATLQRVSSVSGGSIVAGVLGRRWSELAFDATGRSPNLSALVVEPLRALGRRPIDVSTWIIGTLLPGTTPVLRLADLLDGQLLGGVTLQDLPVTPRFVYNATNLASGVLWRFERPYMADYRVGSVPNPTVRLAIAVAASCAFPPFYSPLRLDVDLAAYSPGDYELGTPEYRSEPQLADGGVYDNLGLETAWKRYRTILVSDGGGAMADQPRPATDLVRQSIRVARVVDGQVRALRKRMLIDGFQAGIRDGAYWGVRSDIGSYPITDALPCPPDATAALAALPTRMNGLPDVTTKRLVNWGYAVTDAALRAHLAKGAAPPTGFPCPDAGVG
jgi:NTE family protein